MFNDFLILARRRRLVANCRGFGHEKLGVEAEDREQPDARRATADVTDFKPRIRLEVAVAGWERAEAVAGTIARNAHTGRGRDGEVFLWLMARAIQVRNFALDEDAL